MYTEYWNVHMDVISIHIYNSSLLEHLDSVYGLSSLFLQSTKLQYKHFRITLICFTKTQFFVIWNTRQIVIYQLNTLCRNTLNNNLWRDNFLTFFFISQWLLLCLARGSVDKKSLHCKLWNRRTVMKSFFESLNQTIILWWT